MIEDELMTVEELAEFLKLSKTKIFAMVKDGELPYIKLGNSFRFSKANIINLMHQKQEVSKKVKKSLKGKNPREIQV